VGASPRNPPQVEACNRTCATLRDDGQKHLTTLSVAAGPSRSMPSLVEVLSVDVDWIFNCLTLTELSCSRAASMQLRALLTATWATATNRLSSGMIGEADVAAGTHASALRWMVCNASISRITLRPGVYTIGDDSDPQHVDRVFTDEEIEQAREDGHGAESLWKPGFGPLYICRDLTIVGGTVNGRCGNTTIKLVAAEQNAIHIGQCCASRESGECVPLNVRIENVRILATGSIESAPACLQIETCPCSDKGRVCKPFTGPLLHLKNCTLNGPTSEIVWCNGRAIFEDVTFEVYGKIFIGHKDCLVYIVADGTLEEIVRDVGSIESSAWRYPPMNNMRTAMGSFHRGEELWTSQQLRDHIRATYPYRP